MKRLGFLYDTTRCVGCKACQVACKEKNKLGVGDFFRRVDTFAISASGGKRYLHFSGACNHCANPACTVVCPTGAMYKAADGTVQHDDTRCIACGRCVHNCPYGAPSLNKFSGYAQKCDACWDLRTIGKLPACVAACPTRALDFVSLDNVGQETYGIETLSFLPSAGLTDPSLRICKAGTLPREVQTVSLERECISDSTFRKDTNETFLILGGGAAAVSAARAIRLRNHTAKIQLISSEKRIPYCRPMLSKGALDSFAMDRYPIVEEQWLRENHVEVLLNRTVTALDTEQKQVMLENGEDLSYDKCIYALGAFSFVPSIAGREKRGVFTLRSDDDMRRIRCQMLTTKRAVVIGGGITGLELAWEMKRAGLQVTVLDLAPMLMGRLLDEKSAQLLRSHIENSGVSVATNVRIKEIYGQSDAEGVLLEDGKEFPAELIILSTGFRANIALAQTAGLSVEKAVCVTSAMETSCPDVYACGDCTDLSRSTWMQSIQQGEVAGANAAGDALLWQGEAEPAMVHTAGTSLLSVGDMGKIPDRAYKFVYGIERNNRETYFVNPRADGRQRAFYAFSFSQERLVGATIIGSLHEMCFIQEAVQQQWSEENVLVKAREKGVEIHVC